MIADDKEVSFELLKIFVTNPLPCVADDAYGNLVVQLMQQHPEWADVSERTNHIDLTRMPENPALSWRDNQGPYLITILVDCPYDLDRMNPTSAKMLANMLLAEVNAFLDNATELRIVANSMRVTYHPPEPCARVTFVAIEPEQNKEERPDNG